MNYSIGDIVKKTNISAHTLRYYEKEGLLPFVKKNASGIRVYTEKELSWLTMIECLKQSGLQIKEIAQYIKWYNEGDSTLKHRLSMFQKRKEVIEYEIKNLKKILNKITYKVILYERAVQKGSLNGLDKDSELQKLRKKLFEHPDDFEKQ